MSKLNQFAEVVEAIAHSRIIPVVGIVEREGMPEEGIPCGITYGHPTENEYGVNIKWRSPRRCACCGHVLTESSWYSYVEIHPVITG